MNRHILFAAVLCTALCGCGTVDNMTGFHGEPRIYGGVRRDVEEMRSRNPAAVLDVPFSAVADTVTLPVTTARALVRDR